MGKHKSNSKYRVESLESYMIESLNYHDTPKGFVSLNGASGSQIREQSLKFEISNSPDNLHSPYHLLVSDHPGLALVFEQLDGTN